MAQGVGRYGAEIESLPKVWLAATQRLAPVWWQDPARHLDAVFKA